MQPRLGAVQGCLVVAWSGGLDSTALLAALVACRQPDWPLIKAVHVHHGLQAEADQWVEHCHRYADQWGVELVVQHVQVCSGASLEAQARAARQLALAQSIRVGDVLLLAHHADDQAETILFRLMRGTGLDGAVAMTEIADWHVADQIIPVWRPLLHLRRSELIAYVHIQELKWIEDPSNQDLRLARNFIRHQIIPLLQSRWSRSVEHLVDFADELAMLRQECRHADGLLLAQHRFHHGLNRQSLAGLPLGQQSRVLRQWLQQLDVPVPDRAMLQRILLESEGRGSKMQRWCWRHTGVMCWQGVLYPEPIAVIPGEWNVDALLLLPDGRRLRAVSRFGKGLLLPATYHVAARQGGERLRLHPNGPHHALRTLWQSWNIAPLWRDTWPLLWAHGQLAAVPGLAIAESFLTSSDDEVGWSFELV